MNCLVGEIAGPLVCETAQKAKKFEVTAYFGGQPTLELMRCGVSRAARAAAPEGGVVSLRRIAPPTLSGVRISPGHFSIRPDSLCRPLRGNGFRHQLEEPISLVG
jgi:hypothetical protein